MNRGTTLIELMTVLALTGILASVAAPRLAGGVDRWIVREAREEVVAILYRARMEARRHGEASVRFEAGGGAELEVPGRGIVARWESATPGTMLDVGGTRDEVEISFGPSGVGRVASTTLVLRRGESEAEIVVSSYGRIRR